MSKQKILMITYSYYPSTGGGIRYQKDIVDYFRGQGNIVDVLSVSSDRNMHIKSSAYGSIIELPKLAKVHSAPLSRPYCYLFGKMVTDYDIVHFNFPNPIAEISALIHKRKLKNVKTIVFYHADIVSAKRFSGLYNKLITKRFLKIMDRIIVSSPKMAECSPHLQSFRQKVTVIPFGIDVNYYVPSAPNQHNDDKISPRILFVGRLARYKGLDYLIQAMKDAPGRLSIVGSGPLKEMLVKLRDSLGLVDRVEFCGYVSERELLQKYQQADILVLPSTDAGEAFGYVLIEAMACHTALISTELNTGTSYVNADGETGFVVPPEDVDALSEAIRDLAESPDKLACFKDKAVRRARELFSLEQMLSETKELYRRIM